LLEKRNEDLENLLLLLLEGVELLLLLNELDNVLLLLKELKELEELLLL
jgi:hypothetical protein